MTEPNRRPEKRIRLCVLCDGDHPDEECNVYATMEQRTMRASRRGVCIKCFVVHAGASPCPRTSGCVYCRAWDHHVAVCAVGFGFSSSPLGWMEVSCWAVYFTNRPLF